MLDKKIEMIFPNMKITLNLFNIQVMQPGETPRQVLERLKRAMERGGIGTPKNFNLPWERLLITLTIASLPTYEEEILSKFATLEVTRQQLVRFLDTKSQIICMQGVKDGINSISTQSTQKQATPQPTKPAPTQLRWATPGTPTGVNPQGRCNGCKLNRIPHV